MAQYPNTQYVAHEFVRQYYTMLHKDPTQLHRFYTKESRLTHGGSPNAKSEEPVCGQEAIYEKIAQLNFRNCYAKIRSVDSHPTIGGGVVIQVNGELSNSGMAMRKFMQTFVLAQQEPKKYHVFNDIFRYQDETFEDTENDETIDGTVESENGYQAFEAVPVGQMDTIPDVEQEVPAVDKPTANEVNDDDDFGYSNYMTSNPQENSTEQTNDEDLNKEEEIEEPVEDLPVEPEETEQEPEFLETEQVPEQEVPQESYETEEVKEDDGTEFKEYDSSSINVEESTQEDSAPVPVESDGPPKPVTWAALAKKNTPVSATPAAPAKPAPKKPSPSTQRTAPPKKREESNQPAPKKEPSEESRRRNPAPDNHQIFIGNLPNNVTEKDVRDSFSEYGKIIEVRLNPKNFGFIAFDGPDAPTKILNKTKTIIIHNNTINTEVKRSVGGSSRRDGGGGGGGGGFRRDRGSDKEGRGERRSDNKNTSRNAGQNRAGKNNSFGQKQPRSSDDGKTDNRNKDSKAPREQRQTRR